MPAGQAYVPPADGAEWASTTATAAGFDPGRLADAVGFAQAHDSHFPRDFHYSDGRYVGIVEWNEKGPWSEVSGPVRERGGPAGLVLRQGRIVAEWGDTHRPDMTFSVAKSYLAVLAGVAVDMGLIGNIDDPVGRAVRGPWFDSAHNASITWRHLLQQSSEWDGVLWEKSDQVDHFRSVAVGSDNSRKGDLRARQAPGSYYEYNDVRVNLLALSLLMLFRRPLPEILADRVMGPIGGSKIWEWHGYRTSYVEIDGKRMQSVSGGAHWGGGMFINARDQARLGLLVARGGRWNGTQVLSPGWIAKMIEPSPTNGGYGLLWWLNRGPARRKAWKETCFSAVGAGQNLIWVDQERDIVIVVRWIDKTKVNAFLERIAGAIVL